MSVKLQKIQQLSYTHFIFDLNKLNKFVKCHPDDLVSVSKILDALQAFFIFLKPNPYARDTTIF